MMSGYVLLFLVLLYIVWDFLKLLKNKRRRYQRIYRKDDQNFDPEHVIPVLKNNKSAIRVYNAENGDPLLFNTKFKVRAKPDFIYKLSSGEYVIVEYKSKGRGVKDSDRVQLIASAIAARPMYPSLKKGYVYTGAGEMEFIDLKASSEELFKSIQQEITVTRQAVSKIQPDFKPVRSKCNGCGFKNACAFAIT